MIHLPRSRATSEQMREMKRQERFLLDPLPIRLGELAVCLSGISSSAIHDNHEKIVKNDLEISEHYLEWVFQDVAPGLQVELGDLWNQLIQWRENWETTWGDYEGRASMASLAGDWAQRILDRSGLLDYDDWRTLLTSTEASFAVVEECA